MAAKLLAAHRPFPGTCSSRSVSGACATQRCSPSSGPSLPTSAEGRPSLFGWFTGTTTQSDFSSTCMSAVRLVAFADRPWSPDQGALEISRFSCMLFLSVRGFLDYAGPDIHSRYNVAAVLPPSYSEWSRHPDLRAFRSSIAPPTDASVYASNDTSQCRPQDSRSGWIRYFLSCRALASPTTCRFIPALSGLPVIRGQSICPDSRFFGQVNNFRFARHSGPIRLSVLSRGS
jgi:hypothetical protein